MNEEHSLDKLLVSKEEFVRSTTIDFPDPRTFDFSPQVYITDDEFYCFTDVVHFGGKLTIENLRRAYRSGVFPWAVGTCPTPWYCPDPRAILEFDELHVPRSLRIARRKENLTFTIDRAFREVIASCANVGRKRYDEADYLQENPRIEYSTWITDEFIRAFTALHEAGDAHSVEVWDENGNLVGGLYGVDAGGVFCGESMFHFRSNASKLAFLHLVEHLQTRGATWLDVQMITPHFELLGAKEIPRRDFLNKLEKTLAQNTKLF